MRIVELRRVWRLGQGQPGEPKPGQARMPEPGRARPGQRLVPLPRRGPAALRGLVENDPLLVQVANGPLLVQVANGLPRGPRAVHGRQLIPLSPTVSRAAAKNTRSSPLNRSHPPGFGLSAPTPDPAPAIPATGFRSRFPGRLLMTPRPKTFYVHSSLSHAR